MRHMHFLWRALFKDEDDEENGLYAVCCTTYNIDSCIIVIADPIEAVCLYKGSDQLMRLDARRSPRPTLKKKSGQRKSGCALRVETVEGFWGGK